MRFEEFKEKAISLLGGLPDGMPHQWFIHLWGNGMTPERAVAAIRGLLATEMNYSIGGTTR